MQEGKGNGATQENRFVVSCGVNMASIFHDMMAHSFLVFVDSPSLRLKYG